MDEPEGGPTRPTSRRRRERGAQSARQRNPRPSDELGWLRTGPSLPELIAAYPADWAQAQRAVDAMISRDNSDEMIAYIKRVAQPASLRPGARVPPMSDRVSAEARRQMAAHVLKQAVLRSSTGVSEGRIRFNLVDGFIAQRLLFETQLKRKPVSMWRFRLTWPFVRQRRLLMPLVQPKGIWCFYSESLVAELASLIDGRRCIEIAAGDGTLSRFLEDAGAAITATDDYSWSDSISFPESVLRQDARTALRTHQPEVVICSWPPAGNSFEQHVFATASVQLYIVIGSASEHSTGNWDAYREQSQFQLAKDGRLSRLVLPPEVNHAVYIFTRRASSVVARA